MNRSAFVFLIILLGAIAACDSDQLSIAVDGKAEHLFKQIDPEISGLSFENTLTEGLNTNILMYEYFYNGGGVAIADFNGDQIDDLYFTSNMEENQLYLNIGRQDNSKIGIKYKEVTNEANAGGRSGPWKTGANAIDINNDGRMDLYLCYSGALPLEKRKNQLLVNLGNSENGVPLFEDQAASYGLDSPAFSNQSYFFDYDKDGDLDMLLLNHNPKNLPILNEAKTRVLLATDDQFKGLRLFQNTGRGFIDVTQKAGINGSALSYGLGLAISDLNNDGWPDFYVSNDYNVPDYLYINLGNGKFENQIESWVGHTSQFSMGNDVGDVNGDGYMDILTLDMLPEDNLRQKLLLAPDNYSKYDLNIRSGFYHQNMRNMLQMNNGNSTFSEVGQMNGISNTDWSWSALLADYDNDGYQDLFVTNGYHRDYTNLDFINFMEQYVQEKGRLVRDDVLKIIEEMPASNVANYAFRGSDESEFQNVSQEWGLNSQANSNGAAYADLDNDGDLDLVVNNIDRAAFVFENLSANNFLKVDLNGPKDNIDGIGSKVTVYADEQKWIKEFYPARGYLSSVSYQLHFGLGNIDKVDSVRIVWPDGGEQVTEKTKVNEILKLSYDEAKLKRVTSEESQAFFTVVDHSLNFVGSHKVARDFDRQLLLIKELSNVGPVLKSVDIDGDGLDELFFDGQFSNGHTSIRYNGHLQDAEFFDADGDGDLDVYLAFGGYHQLQADDELLNDQLLFNDGSGQFSSKESGIPTIAEHSSVVKSIDLNGDGHLDLFVGSLFVPGRFPESRYARFLINNGDGKFSDASVNYPKLLRVTDAFAHNDTLIIATAFGPVFRWTSEKELEELTNSGWWNKVSGADLNGDGAIDYVLGNMGTNNQLKVREESPLLLYFTDFDENGSIDPLTFIQNKGYYPLMTRDELMSQLVLFKSIFPDYQSFANADMSKILSALDTTGVGLVKLENLNSQVLLSTESGRHLKKDLPKEAQYSSIHAMSIKDFNHDGKLDLVLCGNDERMKLQLGKMDANYGQFYLGKGEGEFEYISQSQSGLNIFGDVRSITDLDGILYFGIYGKPIVAVTYEE